MSLVFSEQLKDLPEKDTSAVLQHKCTLLYLLAHLNQYWPLEETTLPCLLGVSFECKFPIQEKYYACLYLNLWRQLQLVKDMQSVETQTKTRIFFFGMAGLSSKLQILSTLSRLVLDELQIHLNCFSVSELLQVEAGFFFTNLFAKIRHFNSGLCPKHILLTIESLKVEAPSLLALHLVDLFSLIGEQVDSAMLYMDSQ